MSFLRHLLALPVAAAVLIATSFFMLAPALAFTPAVGIPERACGALDSNGRCTGSGYTGDQGSDPSEFIVTAPESVSDMMRRLDRLTQLAIAAASGEPGALEAYLAELRKPLPPPKPILPPERPNLAPPGKVGGVDLSQNWSTFHALQQSWEVSHPPPPKQQSSGGPPRRGNAGDDVEGICHFEFHTSNQRYLCWRVDLRFQLPSGVPSGANCESSFRGRYKGYPVKYCRASCPQCEGTPTQTETVVNDAVEEQPIMVDPAG